MMVTKAMIVTCGNINRPFSSKNEEHDCSDDEETDNETWTKSLPLFSFHWEAGVKCQNSENPLDFFYQFIISEIANLISRKIN